MSPKTILVTGGAGFIGSYVSKLLDNRGFQVIILDNLCRSALQPSLPGTFIEGDIGDSELLDQIFSKHPVDAVMHFAAFIDVGESYRSPLDYYANNFSQSLRLFQSMIKHSVKTLIFSSTAAVYGSPLQDKITEDHPKNPINPYGHGKLAVEQMLRDFDTAYDFKTISLRYFNAAGGDPGGLIKNCQRKPSNLIPLIFQALDRGEPKLQVNGSDYNTPDGTCVRDYIHLHDLAEAHVLGLQHLLTSRQSAAYNLGNGNGFSVREVIQAVETVTGRAVPQEDGPRREGDPAILVADSTRARKALGWEPKYPDLESIVSHAWRASELYTHPN